MKQSEIKLGSSYIFINNGHKEHKAEFHNKPCIVLKKIKGKSCSNSGGRFVKGKKPDKFLLDLGICANASNLKPV